MIIESIRIDNCNRFTLGNRKSIRLKPTSVVQMILGTNGSGKSSFMELCFSPLTPSANDFDENGYWEFICSVDGSRYELSADYDKKKYSFIKDGEHLNQSRTITVQDTLVEQHFGYTRFIHSILTLKLKFTQMTAQGRSDAISKISNEDFQYAYVKYKEWSKQHSASVSVKKFLTGRVGEESSKLLSREDKERMRGNVLRIKADLREYMSLDRPVVSKYIAEEDIGQSIESFISGANRFLSLEQPVLNGLTKEQFDVKVGVLEDRLSSKLESLTQVTDRLSELENKKEHIKQLTNIDPDVVKKEIADFEQLLAEIPEKNIDVPDDWLTNCDEVISILNNRLSLLDHDFNEAEYREVISAFNEQVGKLNSATNALESIETRINELTSTCEVSCPACSFKFRPGVNEEELDKLQLRLLHGKQYVLDTDVSKSKLEDDLSRLNQSKMNIDNVYLVRDQYYNRAKGLFHYIDSIGGLKKGKSLISNLTIYKKEVGYRHRRSLIESRLQVARMALEAHLGKSEDFGTVLDEFDRLDTLHAVESVLIDQMRNEIRRDKKESTELSKFTSLFEQLLIQYGELSNLVTLYLTQTYLSMMDEEISKLQSTLAINESVLSNNELVETFVKDLEVQLAKVDLDVSSYKMLADAMSPRTGLIAERIRNQATAQVNGINQIIDKIWNYDFKMEVPEDTSGLLDYKFPVTVEGIRRDDVKQGSGSMRHIVDTAFALLAHYSLNLTGFPIFLDEFDSTFDGVHSEKMVGMVRDLADSGRFNHVVVISHNETIQNAFPTAEILVLDDRNLDMRNVVNTHASFK